jgi:hypothetical protein
MREALGMEWRGVRSTRHAFEPLFERGIPPDSVIRLMRAGEGIAAQRWDEGIWATLGAAGLDCDANKALSMWHL